jgi:hypothetical protein
MTLFKMWENAYINKTLPPEWPIWEAFRTWAINNRYKAEYGYKGEFSPEGCLKAMPEPEETQDRVESAEAEEPVEVEVEERPAEAEKGEIADAGKQTKPRSRGRNRV